MQVREGVKRLRFEVVSLERHFSATPHPLNRVRGVGGNPTYQILSSYLAYWALENREVKFKKCQARTAFFWLVKTINASIINISARGGTVGSGE